MFSHCWLRGVVFWYITMCCPLKVSRRFGGTYRLHLQVRRINHARNHCEMAKPSSALGYLGSSTLKMQARCSSATSVDFQRNKWSTLHELNLDLLVSGPNVLTLPLIQRMYELVSCYGSVIHETVKQQSLAP
jgi:hypothetical protein